MKKFILLGLALFASFLVFSQPASASVNDFVIKEFKADYYLSRDNDGRSNLKTVETIVANFPNSDQNHGIERFLHQKYDGHSSSLEIISIKNEIGVKWNYTTKRSNDNLVLRIGDADKYLQGTYVFVITYTQKDVTKNFKNSNADEFYWDVNGTGWLQEFEKVTANIHIEDDLLSEIATGESCYYGKLNEDNKCNIILENNIYSATVDNLGVGENMTFAIAFKTGTFSEYKPKLKDYLFEVVIIAGFFIEIIGLIYVTIKSKDASGRGTIIPEYLPPKGVDVITSSFVIASSSSWLPALYIDLAVRHNIKIIEKKKSGFFGKSTVYELELISIDNITQQEKDFLLNVFDNNLTIGNKYTIDAKLPDHKLGKKLSLMRASHHDKNKSEGYYRDIKKLKILLVAISLTLFAIFILSYEAYVSDFYGILSAILLMFAFFNIFFAVSVKSLSEKGRNLKDYIVGLGLYIKIAEAERLKYLQSVTGSEKIAIDDKSSLVKLYERVLPYAVLLGIEKSWGKVLGDYYQMQGTQPDWYSGQDVFSATLFASTLSSFSSNANSSTNSYESSSGGSGGGGFSGGGGGGGGGGGW